MRVPGRGGRWWSGLNAPLWAALGATLLSAGLYLADSQQVLSIPGLADLERTSVDARFRLRGHRSPKSDDIVIMGLDDRTRKEAAEVFQTRRGWSRLLGALSEYEPEAVALDVFFSSPEVSLRREVVREVTTSYEALRQTEQLSPVARQAREALGRVVEELRGDDVLAETIAGSQVIFLAVLFHIAKDGAVSARRGPEPEGLAPARYGEWVASQGPSAHRPPVADSVSRSMGKFARGAVGAGSVNVRPDPDGSVRRVYGVIDYRGRYYMPLGLTMALRRLGGQASYVAGDSHIRVGERRLPVSSRGDLLLAHLGPGKTFRHISAADVLAGRTPRSDLAGKLVFVGYTDTARDKVSTPFDPRLDGVELHATLAHNVIHGELLRRTGPSACLLTILLLGLVLTALQLRRIRGRRAWVAGVAALVVFAGYLLLAHVLFSDHGLIVEVAAPALSCVLITVTSLVAALFTEGREKAQLRAAFSQYVNDTLVERILGDPRRATLGGVRRELTVLFSDIRGFSSFSEKLEPEVLSAYLNEYLTPMTELVMEQGGMLDKYIGDAVMAVYGAPIDLSDHAERACNTALAMLGALEPLNERWKKRGLPEIAIGIGLNSGPMSVGNMGSEARFDYTVLGDAVNLGARLEGLTKVYRVEVLAGEETTRRAEGKYEFRELDRVRVVGRARPARIYELLGRKGEVALNQTDLTLFGGALEAYHHRDWETARRGFGEFLERHPDDGPARVMLERVQALQAEPPPEDWDGVFEQVSK